ncbi:hypothetical protein GTY62_15225 [Streptomyces sp. SID724]|uniref:hypothetical protein n=1 Tax=Streptomyces sp. SID724 TaxID=2690324 RepID=UPI0013610AA0|nr:hypothetical protein [Streptomyces sp. SID724]
MSDIEEKKPRWSTPARVVAVAALVAVAVAATSGRREPEHVPPEAVGWYGAMELYRTVAMWAGKRAMSAELNYWKAVG